MTLLEYLVRVLLYLFVFGGVAALVFAGAEAVGAIRSVLLAVRSSEGNDP